MYFQYYVFPKFVFCLNKYDQSDLHFSVPIDIIIIILKIQFD